MSDNDGLHHIPLDGPIVAISNSTTVGAEYEGQAVNMAAEIKDGSNLGKLAVASAAFELGPSVITDPSVIEVINGMVRKPALEGRNNIVNWEDFVKDTPTTPSAPLGHAA